MWKNKVAPDMEFVYTPVEILGNAHMHAFSVHGPAKFQLILIVRGMHLAPSIKLIAHGHAPSTKKA